ncbi:MAG: type I-C CRISPR-associated protein Cas8c/Csd1 [Firmicutes bacterium]|nr:type I-C CRISPR-associated protein Cas8c/Csd1 [Bacillota bacterium]
MLIKALCDYYDILSEAGKVLPEGYSNVGIHYLVSLTPEGKVDTITDYQNHISETLKNGKTKIKTTPKTVKMPKRTEKSAIDSNIIEHRPLYLFGLNYAEASMDADDKKAQKSHEACVKTNLEFLDGIDSPVVNAYRNFLQSWDPKQEIHNGKLIELGKKYNTFRFAFCLSGNPDILLHEDPVVKKKWEQRSQEAKDYKDEESNVQCAITGEHVPMARIHNKIKGVYGGQASGTGLVTFNNPSENSYGNEQSYNSNISETAMEKYTEALNYLLQGRNHKILLDDLTILFWAMNPRETCEDAFLAMLNGEPEKMNAEATDKRLQALMESGKDAVAYQKQLESFDDIDENVVFYMVGIKPNASRLSLKFIDRKRYSDVLWNILQFQKDMQVSEEFRAVPFYRIKKELVSPKSSNEVCNPALLSKAFEAVVYGYQYPIALLETVVRRVKTDNDVSVTGNRIRVGLIKAVLNRMTEKEEITMALDRENQNQAYLCGRLFAVLEQLQDAASGGNLNSTIKERFFASAASKPVLVFPKVLKLSQNHLEKFRGKNEKNYVFYSRLISEIIDMMQGEFPDTLLLADQGKFIIGYYQQRQRFFEKKNTDEQ